MKIRQKQLPKRPIFPLCLFVRSAAHLEMEMERELELQNLETKKPLSESTRRIFQSRSAATECEITENLKSTLTQLLTKCKDKTYRNSGRCFRIFLLATAHMRDTDAMKVFDTFYRNKIFIQLSAFYINWARRCEKDHDFVRAILIEAERMHAKPKYAIENIKRRFVEKEEDLAYNDNNGGTKVIGTEIYPWDTKQQAKLINEMEQPSFMSFYYVRSKHLGHWDAYIYNYVKEELCRISGALRIFNCLTFIDQCLTIQEFAPTTLKELSTFQNSYDPELCESIVAIIALDLMKILRCIHRMGIIHGCFRSDNIFVTRRISCKPEFDTLSNGEALLVKVANWDFAIRNVAGTKYCGHINDNKVVTNGNYECGSWNYEIDRKGFLNIVYELIWGKTLQYSRSKSGHFIPMLNFERDWLMCKYWSHLFHKCLDPELQTWDTLIGNLAPATYTLIWGYDKEWYTAAARYNVLFMELSTKSKRFYP